jgi:hypothetical protein
MEREGNDDSRGSAPATVDVESDALVKRRPIEDVDEEDRSEQSRRRFPKT